MMWIGELTGSLSAGKFSVEFTRRILVCGACLFRGIEQTKISLFSAVTDICAPFLALLAKVNSTNAALVRVWRGSVDLVFGSGDMPKVCPSIISFRSVDVVDLLCRPISGHVQPHQAVRAVCLGVYFDVDVSLGIGATGFCASTAGIPHLRHLRPISPREKSGFWVVVQHAAQFVRRQIGAHSRALWYEFVSHSGASYTRGGQGRGWPAKAASLRPLYGASL